MPQPGLLESLSDRATLAIFTGRAKYEADATLNRYARAPSLRPHRHRRIGGPTLNLRRMVSKLSRHHHPGKQIWYLGDTVDDARSAQAAQVPFIGVAMPHNARHAEIADSLRNLGAFAILQDINELKPLFAGASR